MAKYNSHTDPKWNDLLNAYREGTITPDALHQLEKAALDDPFLFDALEGYALYNSSSDGQNIQDLASLTPRKETKIRKIDYFRWSSVAAIFLILVAVTYFMRDQFSGKEITVATNTTTTVSNEASPIAGMIDSEEEGIEKPITQKQSPTENEGDAKISNITEDDMVAEKDEGSMLSNSIPSPPPSVMETPVPSSDDESRQNKDIAQSDKSQNQIEAQETILEEGSSKEFSQNIPPENVLIDGITHKRKKSELPTDNRSEKKKSAVAINGQIVDQNGLPLIGANVQIENTNIGSITDTEGRFSLPAYPSGIQLVSSYTGFEPAYTMIQDDSFYNITLTESRMLDEVIAVDFSIPATEEEVMPEILYEGLEAFIQQYKNIPIKAFSDDFKGNITVEFMINEDGSLSEFFSKDEGCNACINEAIRLLKLAGKWKTIPEGMKRKAAYTISF